MNKKNDNTLDAIKNCLASTMPPHSKAILFGSQARGTARAGSDWDILVILDKDRLLPSDYNQVTFPLTSLGWDLNQEINPVMYTAQEWQKYKITPFCKNVEKEGVTIWG